MSPDPDAGLTHRFRSRLDRGEWIVSVEVDPPHGLSAEEGIVVTAALRDAGVDCIDVGDSPMASVRMSPLSFAAVVQQRTGVEAIIHFAARDRNLMALQSDLLGAHMLGIRTVIALSGDPPSLGRYANASAVWDVKAEGLITLIARLNAGQDSADNSLGAQADFTIATAANPNADDWDTEFARLQVKIANGAHVLFTQPCFDVAVTERFLERAAGLQRPVILGVLPLVSERNARYMATQVPGITVPDTVVARMTGAGDGAREEGLNIAREYLAAVRPLCAGIYLIPVLNQFQGVTQLVRELRGRD